MFSQLPGQMTEQTFVSMFGSLYEHSPWVAQRTWQAGVGAAEDSLEGLAAALARTLEQASQSEKLALILEHPDLAGRAAIGGELTAESTDEQASAGIDQCTAEEFARFQQLNESYKEKFCFPFIMAVRGSNRHKILQAFETRIHHDVDAEFSVALQEINKIARLRLQAMIDSDGK